MWSDEVLEYQGSTVNKPGALTFVGKMNAEQRDALKNFTADKTAIDAMFEETQPKWPAEQWKAIQGHRHHYVSWIFYGLVIAFCLTSPRWWPGAAKRPSTEPDQPPAPAAS